MNSIQRQEIADAIIRARKERGWSQRRLAEAAGVSENTVLAAESGKRHTQEGKLRAIMTALEMPEPSAGIVSLDGVPEDVRIFITVATQRLQMMDEDERNRVLADIYPRLLMAQ